MRIERITKINGYRIFRNYRWPNDLQEFSRFNLIYGWNGAGKTTISGIFRALEKKASILEGEVEFVIDGRRIQGRNIPSESVPEVRVFNRDSVERAVFESKDAQLDPIYYIGEDSASKQREVEELKAKEKEISGELSSIQGSRRKAERVFEDFCSGKALEIKNLLTRQGGGRYSTYNSARYKAAIANILLVGEDVEALPEDERRRLHAVAMSSEMPRLSPVPEPRVDVLALIHAATELLKREVTSKVISDLMDKPDASAWIHAGMSIHEKYGDKDCIYCGAQIAPDRTQALRDHFNDQVKLLNSEIDALTRRVASAKNLVASVTLPAKVELYPHLVDEYEKSLTVFRAFQKNLDSVLERLASEIQLKRDSPFRSMGLSLFPPDNDAENGGFLKFLLNAAGQFGGIWAGSAIDRISLLIDRHNEHSSKFSAEISKAQELLEKDYVLASIQLYRDKYGEHDRLTEEESRVTSERADVLGKIAVLQSQLVEHRRSIDELNSELASYLGHSDIRFEVLDTGYRIVRNGVPALNLSEGERTAIAFMYFLKSLNGTDFDITSGVVVVDDPVSSLDANSMYSAFSFMKDRLKSAGQLIVLTHNFEFFRLVKDWFRHIPNIQLRDGGSRPGVSHYMLRASREGGVRYSEIRTVDPLLLKYESDYHYLFSLVYDAAGRGQDDALERSYTLPNVSRRLLEAVFAFKYPGKDSIHNKMGFVQYDAALKTRVLRFLDVHSHSDRVGGGAHDLFHLSEARSVMRDVLRLIRHIDPIHYENMVKAIGQTPIDLDPVANTQEGGCP